jgi:hypothetical protein
MISSKPEKIILGYDIKPSETDDETENLDEVSISYDIVLIINSIGTEDFKSTYLNFIDNIKQQTLQIQKYFCNSILEKIESVYSFVFPNNVEPDNQQEVEQIYSFLEFVEYNHINFLSKLWIILNEDLNKINITNFCHNNIDKILYTIDELIEITNLTVLVDLFLKIYDKKHMLEFIIKKTEYSKPLVILAILETDLTIN